jgi:DMSO/TMAO reductase YedYZ molybdopterin-dependent catalytic subunit
MTSAALPSAPPPVPPHRAEPSVAHAALAGVAAALVAIAAGEVFAGLVPGAPSLVVAVGDLVIALQPAGAKDLVVGLFGGNDKAALQLVIVGAALLIAAGAGVVARRRFERGAWAFVIGGGFALVASMAVAGGVADPILALAAGALAVAAGLVTLRWLLTLAGRAAAAPRAANAVPAATALQAIEPEAAPAGAAAAPGPGDAWARRRFLIASAATIGVAAVAGTIGRNLVERRAAEEVVVASRLPAALEPAPSIAPDQKLAVPGITPLVVPTKDFYRIDTALLVPRVDVASWRLQVTGMVERPVELTYDELLELPLVEQHITIACVSNPVGGHLVGNARWTGVPLRDLLEMAGVQDGATQVVGRSVDGFTAGFPTSWALEPGREALVAVGMNGEPLPAKHGFPARLVVPGLYGYVSATKWLATIELTTREAVDGFWIPLGWAKDAPILTQSRIDVPGTGARLAAGPVDVAGVAWAPDRGIAGVEICVDDGPWQAALTSRPISGATWVQWAFAWNATPGRHAIEVRAIDGSGEVQTDRETDPAPDGARGHHRIRVSVD